MWSTFTLVVISDLYTVALHCSLAALHCRAMAMKRRSRLAFCVSSIQLLVLVSHTKPCMRVCRHVHVYVLSITAYVLIQSFNGFGDYHPRNPPIQHSVVSVVCLVRKWRSNTPFGSRVGRTCKQAATQAKYAATAVTVDLGIPTKGNSICCIGSRGGSECVVVIAFSTISSKRCKHCTEYSGGVIRI